MPVTFYRPIPHGANRLHTAPLPPPRRRTPCPPRITIGNLNIRDVRLFGLVQSIRAVESRVFGVMLLTETKISTTAYFRNRLSYNMTFLVARMISDGGAKGGVGLVTSERPVGWGIDSTRYHRLNVIICEIFPGLTQTPLVGAYLPLLTLENLTHLDEVLQLFRDPNFLGGLKVDLKEAKSPLIQQVAELLTE